MSLKYAFTSSSCPAFTLAELIEAAERYEYDGVETRVEWKHGHGVEPDASAEQRLAVRRAFEKTDVALCCVSTGCRYVDPATHDAQIEHTHRCIDLAGDVGCPRVRVFGGMLHGAGREAAAERIVHAMNAVLDHAAERGVTLVIETHDDWAAPRHLLPIIEAVGHPNLGVLWDVTHPVVQAGETITQAHDELMHVMKHVHVHDAVVVDGRYDWKPIGQGQFDLREAIALLLREAFGGYVSGEWIDWSDPPETHLPRELATLKRYEQELLA